jgi:hypothetical protein
MSSGPCLLLLAAVQVHGRSRAWICHYRGRSGEGHFLPCDRELRTGLPNRLSSHPHDPLAASIQCFSHYPLPPSCTNNPFRATQPKLS